MALHPNFSESPYEISPADFRRFPAAEELRSTSYDKPLLPVVANIRKQVEACRASRYTGASATSHTLLRWWFNEDHPVEGD